MNFEQKFESESFLIRMSSLGNVLWILILLVITIMLFYISANEEANVRLLYGKYGFLLMIVTNIIITIQRSKNSLIKIKRTDEQLHLEYFTFNKMHSEILNLTETKIEEKRTWDRYSNPYLSISTKSRPEIKFHLSTYKKFGEAKMTELIRELNGRV